MGGLAHVELDGHAAVDQHPVAPVGQVERHVLVGAVGLAAEGVVVPHQGPLAALVQRGELLPEADEPFVAERDEALVPGDGCAVGGGPAERQGAASAADVPGARVLVEQQPAVGGEEPQVPRVEADLGDDRSGVDVHVGVVHGDRGGVGPGMDQGQGAGRAGAGLGVVGEADPDHAVTGGVEADHQAAAVGQGGLERHPVRVRGDDLGPADGGHPVLARLPYGQVGRVGHERLVRDQRRSVRHRRLLGNVFQRYRQFLCFPNELSTREFD